MEHRASSTSLAPYGFVFPLSRERLEYTGNGNPYHVNVEKMIAEHWARVHSLDAPWPFPIRTIIHEILPAQAAANRISGGDFVFDRLPYLERDVRLLSTVVQWLGTHVGSHFLNGKFFYHEPCPHPSQEFVHKLSQERKRGACNLALQLTHECTSRCGESIIGYLGQSRHRFDPRVPQPRDKAVLDGLMRWLGSTAGRSFIAAHLAEKQLALKLANGNRYGLRSA